ncbi:MAG: ribosome biogenesis GTPase Der, partial [Lactobacillales bacterium]|nr:ribosome biogenesis GTPase Der [Lactobacillales bacterium]
MKTIAIVGKTNVGKSTFFNRLAGKKLAIVHDRPGVTRDRKEAAGTLKDLSFNMIDTAGLEETTELAAAMWRQTQIAIEQADIILMVVDARAELNKLDEQLAKTLRGIKKPVFVIANKCEGAQQQHILGDAYRLGLGDPIAFSAEHALGLDALYKVLAPFLKEKETVNFENDAEEAAEDSLPDRPLKLAIVGRPNVGKSTLINKLLKDERLLTGPMAGVTRDAITIPWEYNGKKLLMTDTAGLRKKGKVNDSLEFFSARDTRDTIDFAEVVILVLDANVPMERQDLSIADYVIQNGRCLIIALNKWDAVDTQKKTLNDIKETLATSLQQVKGIPLLTISAKTGYGLDRMMSEVFNIYALWNKRVSTHKLNNWLGEMITAHPTPVAKNGRRIP